MGLGEDFLTIDEAADRLRCNPAEVVQRVQGSGADPDQHVGMDDRGYTVSRVSVAVLSTNQQAEESTQYADPTRGAVTTPGLNVPAGMQLVNPSQKSAQQGKGPAR